MNSVLEISYAWTGSFVEAFHTLTCDVANIIFESLGITSNLSGSETSTTSSSTPITSTPVASSTGEKTLPNKPKVLEEAASFFEFDDFQYLLLKIFIVIILSNVLFIYIAWQIYGERITERFMTPNNPEELEENIQKLNLPREHSQRL